MPFHIPVYLCEHLSMKNHEAALFIAFCYFIVCNVEQTQKITLVVKTCQIKMTNERHVFNIDWVMKTLVGNHANYDQLYNSNKNT